MPQGSMRADNATAIDVSSEDWSGDATGALYIGEAGDIKVDFKGGATGITLKAAFGFLPIQVTKIYNSGTTAASIVALWA